MIWTLLHPQMTPDHLGFIPSFLSEDDPRSAKDQIASNYISGWDPLPGFNMLSDGKLKYPGDPIMQPLAETKLRNEVIRYYEHSWLSITQPDGTYEVARLD